MDEMKLKLTSNLMRGLVSKIISKLVYKQLGYHTDIHINEIQAKIIDGKASIHLDIDGEINRHLTIKSLRKLRLFFLRTENIAYYEEVIKMKSFIAKNPKQLDLCLKLMYVENVKFTVDVTQTKHKIIYYIYALVTDSEGENLERKYNVLIS